MLLTQAVKGKAALARRPVEKGEGVVLGIIVDDPGLQIREGGGGPGLKEIQGVALVWEREKAILGEPGNVPEGQASQADGDYLAEDGLPAVVNPDKAKPPGHKPELLTGINLYSALEHSHPLAWLELKTALRQLRLFLIDLALPSLEGILSVCPRSAKPRK